MLREWNNHDTVSVFAFWHAHVPPTRRAQDARTFTEAYISDNRIDGRDLRTCATITERWGCDLRGKWVPRRGVVWM
jgi:hypothetical protein